MKQPLLGMMTTDLPKALEKRNLTPTWLVLAEEGRAAGWPVLFFHPHHIVPGKGTVRGFLLSEDGSWRYETAPLPAVVVDHVFVHIARTDPKYVVAKRALLQKGIRVVNPRLPDKRGVWKQLGEFAPLKPYLPETAVLNGVRDVESWLDRYSSVFIKPVRGSKGRGVVRIIRSGDGQYVLTEHREKVLSLVELHRLITARLKKEKHLLQQGLSLVETEGSKIDLRVVLYRDGDKVWRPVATVPRVGLSGQAVTNLAQGGRTESFGWLEDVMRKQKIAVPARELVEQVAVLTAEALTPLRPTLAFLGIDIGVTRDGRLYPLDINPRPGRQVLSMEDRRNAYRYLVGFCRTLR